MPTRPDLRPVSRPVEPPPDHLIDRLHLDPDEPTVRHDGVGTLITVVTLFVLLAIVCLVTVG